MRQNVPNYFHCLLSVRLHIRCCGLQERFEIFFGSTKNQYPHVCHYVFSGEMPPHLRKERLIEKRMIYGRWMCGDISGFGGVKY